MNKSKEQLIEEAKQLWDTMMKADDILRNALAFEPPRPYNEEILVKSIDGLRSAANEVISLLNTTLVQNQYIK